MSSSSHDNLTDRTALEVRIAARLRAAYRDGVIDPIGNDLGPSDLAAAYRVQSANTEHWLAGGRRLTGHKIGLTSSTVQKQLGVDQPDFGVLFEDMRVANQGTVDLARLLQPKVEAEIALSLKKDLDDPALQERDFRRAIDWVAAAIEIVDSRVRDWRISIVDTVADNASSGLFVLGEERVDPEGVDVVNCRMSLRANGAVASEGRGAACLGSPYLSAFWLARKMIELGRPLRAGNIILTGALGPMVSVQPDTTYTAAIETVGTAAVYFAKRRT